MPTANNHGNSMPASDGDGMIGSVKREKNDHVSTSSGSDSSSSESQSEDDSDEVILHHFMSSIFTVRCY